MFEISEVYDSRKTEALYQAAGIERPEGCDDYIAVFDQGEVVAAAAIKGNILMGFAVSPRRQGEGLLAVLCTELIRLGQENGTETFYIFTKPEKASLFSSCGFQQVAAVSHTALLEWGAGSIEEYIGRLKRLSKGRAGQVACIVMNANPFTLGHRCLVERAAGENDWLYVIVVEEERSEFSYRHRLELVRRGVADLPNVTVLGGGPYVISQLTFPTYFLKHGEAEEARAELDIELFCSRIVPALGIQRRYVGEEPFSRVTASYNRELERMLPERQVELVEIPRKELGGTAVSASRVRSLLRSGDLEAAKRLLPSATANFLDTAEGRRTIEAMRQN